ncbi:MAG TPA: PIG-L family deacetylase [Candidatus Sulfotelmatobacter sp.]|nr:PIG-L family deacetylase [Candidatus Sulfotelmatobacter sp.]
MNATPAGFRLVVLLLFSCAACAQVFTPDERYKADILVVVAHPDDDTLVSSYLARAIYDQHKKVAVVYCTRGDSGGNAEAREHARALGLVREIEGRRALNFLGIANVWFLDGRDTSSQNVLVSLAAWPSASVLEQTVRIVRLTRPEVVFTWLPSSVAGENHGDHQAAGVIATEAFDLAGDPAQFPWQLAAPIRQYENGLEGLDPWQPKKLYYFTDAFDASFFGGHGPEYSGKEVSPSRRVSYLQLAAQSAAAYYTQSADPSLNRQIEAGQKLDEIVSRMQQAGYFPEPVRLWLAKSHVAGAPTADVFEGVRPGAVSYQPPKAHASEAPSQLQAGIGGPWGFYRDFWRAHELDSLRDLRPEMAVQPNDTLTVPLLVRNPRPQPATVSVALTLPAGWKQKGEARPMTVPPEGQATIAVPVIAPPQENTHFAEIRINALANGTSVFQGSIFVQVSRYVAEQIK